MLDRDHKLLYKHVKTLLQLGENEELEFKSSYTKLPKSFWETYSSFCNTKGGIVILGIKETEGKNKPCGVKNPIKIKDSLFDNLSNTNKVNYSELSERNVHILNYKGNDIIIVTIPEVNDSNKPIYINNNIKYTYLRKGSGDMLATDDELKTILRNASKDGDSNLLTNSSLNDIDDNSFILFRDEIDKNYPSQGYKHMSKQKFLESIGGYRIDRKDGTRKLNLGTLLFLGKYQSIKDFLPHYHLDYLNYINSHSRWKDRVASDEPNKSYGEMNLYNFYKIVSQKLYSTLSHEFQLDNQIRISNSTMNESLREAFVNTLMHADYKNYLTNIKIEATNMQYKFTNPGKMLVSKKEYAKGGTSIPRNEKICSYFRLIGASERQGMGGRKIFSNSIENNLRSPDIDTDLNKTILSIWTVDLADSYPGLDDNSRSVLKSILSSKAPQSRVEIEDETNLTKSQTRTSLEKLQSLDLVESIGQSRATKYQLNRNSPEFIAHLQSIVDEISDNVQYIR